MTDTMTYEEEQQGKKGLEILDKCYNASLNGLPTSKTAIELANEYLSKNNYDSQKAAKKMIAAQTAKCTTTGFLTGLGGLITLPVAIPADVAGNLYVQIRMIAAIAVMGGLNPRDDTVKTLVYTTLVGISITDVVKQAGIKVGNKITLNVINKIPGKVLIKINQKVGLRLFTKAGSKGIINLTKMVPIMGGFVGGAFDLASTKMAANRAVKLFLS